MKVSKVVDAHNLEIATRDGWHLVFTGSEQKAEYLHTRPPTAEEKAGGQYGGITTQAIATKMAFVVEKDVEVITREEKAAAETAAAIKNMNAAKTELEQAAGDRDAAKSQLESAQHSAKYCREGWDTADAKARRLELDIAKLRTAIGDLRMKEILGG